MTMTIQRRPRRTPWPLAGLLLLLPGSAMAASVRTEIHVDVSPDAAWAALRDVGAVHTRLARGFVADTALAGDVRTITFAEGINPPTAKERIVAVDDATRRIAYGAIETRAIFHSASLQVVADGKGSRLVWITDILPDAFKDAVRANMQRGMDAMKQTLEQDAHAPPAGR
jgi:hypothetical protein